MRSRETFKIQWHQTVPNDKLTKLVTLLDSSSTCICFFKLVVFLKILYAPTTSQLPRNPDLLQKEISGQSLGLAAGRWGPIGGAVEEPEAGFQERSVAAPSVSGRTRLARSSPIPSSSLLQLPTSHLCPPTGFSKNLKKKLAGGKEKTSGVRGRGTLGSLCQRRLATATWPAARAHSGSCDPESPTRAVHFAAQGRSKRCLYFVNC